MTWTRSTAIRRALALTATLTVASLLPMSAAEAHSDLVGSDPADGAALQAAPGTVRLTFSEDVEPQFATVAITVGDGEPAEVPTRVEGADVVADVTSVTPAGTEPGQPAPWVVAYRVVSADGHPITGTTAFTVTAPTAAPPAEPTTTLSAPPADPEPAPTSSPSATSDEVVHQNASTTDEGGPSATVWIVVAAAVAVAAAILVWLFRRRGAGES